MSLLRLLAKFYAFLSFIERRFFDIFHFLVYKPDARVVSVGNISMGGTGKTPVLFELLSEINVKTCVLTRGYKSPWERSFYHLHGTGAHPHQLTDEALMLNARYPHIPVYIGKNRHHSAIMAAKTFAPALYLLDDGFQYRRLHKDYNIILFDAMCTDDEAQVVPCGTLREPLTRLSAANAILLTRCNTAPASRVDYWLAKIRDIAPNVPVIKIGTYCDGVFNVYGKKLSVSDKSYLAFSAIGRPQSFYAQLESMGCNIAIKREFRDHHRFAAKELNALYEEAVNNRLTLICTEKDCVKIPTETAIKMNLEILRIRLKPLDGRTFLDALALTELAS